MVEIEKDERNLNQTKRRKFISQRPEVPKKIDNCALFYWFYMKIYISSYLPIGLILC